MDLDEPVLRAARHGAALVAQQHQPAGALGDDVLAAAHRHGYGTVDENRRERPVTRSVAADRVGDEGTHRVDRATGGVDVDVDPEPVAAGW